LLAAGQDVETYRLREALENSKAHAFSADARVVLLRNLRHESKSAEDPPDNLLHAYSVMSTRFFTEAEPTDPSRPDIRREILSLHLPSLLATDRGRAMVRQAVDHKLADQFRRKAVEFAGKRRLAVDEQEGLRSFLACLTSR
jgi:hypothetical protein